MINNIEQNKSKINIEIGNSNNLKNNMDYKNINTTQTDKKGNYNNKKFIQYIKPLLVLLQKAEQILSIINLPVSSIDKYNQLKEISFKKCGLEYTPLVKNVELIKNFQHNNNNKEENKIKYNKILYELSICKNKIIDMILTFIETNKLSNINNNKDDKLFLNSKDFNINCNILKEEINKIFNDLMIINLNSDNKDMNNEANLLFNEKEKILNFISRSQQNMISILYEYDKKFNELKEAFIIQNSKNEYLNKYINNIDELISPIWNKYFNNEIDWFDPNKLIDKHELKTYTKSHFLLNFMNQLFVDNKNLMEALTEMEKKKNEAYNILKLPYIKKVIEKGGNLQNIENLLEKLKEEKGKNKDIDVKKLIKDGKELINCIKETINENPQIDDNELKNNINNNEKDDIYCNYNDDMNLILGRLMNGIQNILNKLDISIKKDELAESIIKVNKSKNENTNNDISNISINKSNMNNNNTNMNINNITNNGIISKDVSFISSNYNDINSSKLQNMSFQIYKKKTNHISGSNIVINNNSKNSSDYNDNKNNYESFNSKNKNIKEKILYDIKKENQKEEIKEKNINKKEKLKKLEINNNIINDNIIIKSINNIINDKNYNEIKINKNLENTNKNINNDNIANEEKSLTVGDIGNNIIDTENSKSNNSKIIIKNDNNNQIKDNKKIKEEILNKEVDITDEGIEVLKNMVLEDFKSRISEEK